MKKKILGMTIISILFISGCGVPKLSDGKELVAKIDGFEVTADDVYQNLKKQYGTGTTIDLIDNYIADKEVKDSEEATKYVDTQIEMYKLQYEDFDSVLVSSGYKDEADFRQVLLNAYKKNIVIENYYKDLITDYQIQTHYEKEIFGAMDVRHILVIPEKESTNEEQEKANEAALNKAKDLINKLNDGADFSELAKEHSEDEASKEDGGLIEGVTKDKYVVEFFNAAYELKDDEYTKEPVKSEFGYHVIFKIKGEEKPSLEEVKEDIVKALVTKITNEDENAGMKAWKEVRKKYKIELFDKDVKNIYEKNISNLN